MFPMLRLGFPNVQTSPAQLKIGRKVLCLPPRGLFAPLERWGSRLRIDTRAGTRPVHLEFCKQQIHLGYTHTLDNIWDMSTLKKNVHH